MTPFCGKTRDYVVETYYSGKKGLTDASSNDKLVQEIIRGYLAVYPTRDRELSINRMMLGLSHPKTILELVSHDGILVGCGIFPLLSVRDELAVYSTRFFLPEHEREGLGTYVLENAINLHQEKAAVVGKQVKCGVLMTQNAFSIVSLWKIPIIGETFPISKPSGDQGEPSLNLYPQGSTPQRLMLGIHGIVYMSSRSINTRTGVSRGELSELGMNESYKPTKDHPLAWKVHHIMVSPEGLDMNREAGDEAYVAFRLKKPNNADVEINGM